MSDINKRFSKLNEACKKNPTIVLNVYGKPYRYYPAKKRAEEGFIKKFCS